MTHIRRIDWNSKLEIGVKRIDFEHQIFAELINILADKIDNGEDKLSLARTLREIIKYADFHFTSEENIMEECKYPGIKEHVVLHRTIQRGLSDRVMDMVGDKTTADEILHFLTAWFVEHTQQEDIRIALYTKNNRSINPA